MSVMQKMVNFDINKIPLEQQICLLKANDNVKEKAMMKLKEVKAKSEDSGSKARQYLDGLLKIPFNGGLLFLLVVCYFCCWFVIFVVGLLFLLFRAEVLNYKLLMIQYWVLVC